MSMTSTTRTRARELQILLSSEAEDRVTFGLNLALAAAVSDVEVVVFFALQASHFVCARHEAPAPITELLEQLRALNTKLFCCSACAHAHCRADGEEEHAPLVEGVRRAGLATFVQRASRTHETISL